MINIYMNNDNFYVWNAKDACHIREQHHIVGTLVGCLPRLPRQNIHLGLPLQLSTYEVQLLLDKGFAKLRNDSNQSATTSMEELETCQLLRQQSYSEQLESCKVEKQKTMMQNLDRIVLGKRQKLKSTNDLNTVPVSKKQSKKKMRNLRSSGTADAKLDIDGSDEDEIRKQVKQEIYSMNIPATLPDKAVCIQIHTANFMQPNDDSNVITEWNFDKKPRDALLYHVFRHFWQLGYFLTSGGKFGGDFLIYPGDPSRYHSYYIAVCVEHEQPLQALQIVALGRLGTSVKKTVLLCSVDSLGFVHCTSLQWTGIS